LPRALIIGHKGQDGVCLSKVLTGEGYGVSGVGRVPTDIGDHTGDFPDIASKSDMYQLMARMQPEEIYYLAAFHHSSQEQRVDDHLLISRSLEVNTLGLNNVLDAVARESPQSRVFYAGSSLMFGNPQGSVQNEDTPFRPQCAYGISKTAGAHICAHYRATRGVFAVVGVLYNHESPLRPPHFISRKIVSAAVRAFHGCREKLVIGDLDAQVDWGYAPDYAEGMWRMLQMREPLDCVIGTGVLHSVRDFVDLAFQAVRLDWRGHVTVDPGLLSRRSSGIVRCADSTRLRSLTGWRPTVDFPQMVRIMIEAEQEEQSRKI
jgi:GDPmannose 4,6-dehydratase